MDANAGEALVKRFEHMVSRDGGALSLLLVEGDTIRVGYRPGIDPECADGSCVLPGAELQSMMSETVRRQDPRLEVVVEVIR